jgi:hypothetical protein
MKSPKRIFVNVVLCCSWSCSVQGYAKLGSEKPVSCNPSKLECPSHMRCVSTQNGHSDHKNHCVCDRYFGFKGEGCEETTRASWFLCSLSVITALWALKALSSNVTLFHELSANGRIKANNIGRTLLFNTLMTLPLAAFSVGIVLTLVGVDEDMEFYEHGRQICISSIFLFFILSTLSVSVVWIIDVVNTTTSSVGADGVNAKKRKKKSYLLALYALSFLLFVIVAILISFLDSFGVVIPIAGLTFTVLVGTSYHLAGRRVLSDLQIAQVREFLAFISFFKSNFCF